MEWRFQWIVVKHFLPEVLDDGVYDEVFRPNGTIHTRYFDPKRAAKADMPVEFSVAAYRFGHSQVRKAYRITEGGSPVQVFSPDFPTVEDLRGGRSIDPNHRIFWPNFISIDGVTPPVNISRKIDTLLSEGLFFLPPGAATGVSILAKRNIQRAREYGLPSGQAVAAHLGLDFLTNADIAEKILDADGNQRLAIIEDPAFKGEVPLWLYILAESEIVHNGAKLGPVGSRIVAEVIGGLLAADRNSFYRRGWAPEGGDFSPQDLLREAGVCSTC
jgi:Animal haem peroxidase